jgi:hypothetical protein
MCLVAAVPHMPLGAGAGEAGGEEKKKKKKKKPKKKKKKANVNAQEEEEEEGESDEDEAEPTSAPAAAEPSQPEFPKSPPATPKPAVPATKQKSTPAKPKSPVSPSVPFDPFASKLSLASAQETKAQSAHAYLQETQANAPKVKVKSRPERAASPEQKKGLFSKLTGGNKDKDEEESKPLKSSEIFASLRKRSKVAMRRLFGVTAEEKKGGIKWQQFVQVSFTVNCCPRF